MNANKLNADVKEAVGSLAMNGHLARNCCTEVKTDGSYTRPPTLDRRNSLFGPATRWGIDVGPRRFAGFELPVALQEHSPWGE